MWSGVESAGVSSKPLGKGNDTSTYASVEGCVLVLVVLVLMVPVVVAEVAVENRCLSLLAVVKDTTLLDLLIKKTKQTRSKPQQLRNDIVSGSSGLEYCVCCCQLPNTDKVSLFLLAWWLGAAFFFLPSSC